MINTAHLLGRVGKKDTKTLKNGTIMTHISLATTKRHIDPQGEKREITTWHPVNFFSKMAETAQKYVHVGDLLFVTGEINYRKVESGEREGQYIYSFTATDLKFIPTGNKKDKPDVNGNTKPKTPEPATNEVEDDEIPF